MVDVAYIIETSETLVNAIKKLGKNKHKGLIVMENGKVVDVFTRYDMVKNLYSFSLEQELIKSNLKSEFDFYLNKIDENDILSTKHCIIPVINEQNELLNIAFPQKKPRDMTHKYPVVIMAGGLGTRLYPYTKVLPKPLVPVNGTPMVEIIMNRFTEYGCKDFKLIVNHKKEMIQAYFDNLEKDYSVSYGIEMKQLGSGGGLYHIKDKLEGDFFLTNCDTLLLEDYDDIFEYHKQSKSVITMIVSVKSIDIPYGVISINDKREIIGSKEKPSYGILINTGMYVVNDKVLEYIQKEEIVGFPTIIDRVKSAGGKVSVYPIPENCWLDMGQVDTYQEACETIKKEGL